MERDNRVYLNPSGMSGIHAVVANVINSRHNGLIEQTRKDILDLALFSGVANLWEEIQKIDAETERQLIYYDSNTEREGILEKFNAYPDRLRYTDKRNTFMLTLVMKTLTANGIWAKILRDVASNTRSDMEAFR